MRVKTNKKLIFLFLITMSLKMMKSENNTNNEEEMDYRNESIINTTL